ncbi:MAG TPA: fatty acid oxidation complex subunit alpha FadJ [Candidatus Competibacteraceae bacterium]|nr:fatty acid oxidation complex subunit alpha FadJ [Candidatus Competibacteraceae bacterium]HQA26531.1 fatty acid oxidation complex subunit alpha FadJ [Candidatus Competibacteraceae bacterium]HQD54854.1 fatty acid oxidation complex subunit alpha FadJ [Candidatus Competibacteraceae bacterium]
MSNDLNSNLTVFQLALGEDGIAVVTIDLPGESQNTLKAAFITEAHALLDRLEQDSAVQGVVFISGKPGSFIAGADINMLQACRTAAEATELSKAGQRFFDRLANFKVPMVAAIDGACLGGGLELALACHGRICTDQPKTALGLPEVMLGVLPGSGGTQRLPRLIGIPAALDLMLTGKHLNAQKARRLGLVDDVAPATILLPSAIALAKKLRSTRPVRNNASLFSVKGLTKLALEDNPLGRRILFQQAREQVLGKTRGHYPAPLRIIDCVEIGASRGLKKGLEAEALGFGELAITPQARQLMHLYFATTALKKDSGVADARVQPRPVRKVGVLGAGLMGAGIAYVTANKARVPVRLKDKEAAGLNRGMAYLDRLLQKRLKRRSITSFEAGLERHRVMPTLDFSGFHNVELVIEAVFEDLPLKHRMIADVEAHCPATTIFATNTSSIPITQIAAAAQRPENVIGMHYFSPVEKMPLLEVITTPQTAPEVIATTVDFGRKQGKTVIVVQDGAGFYVNRILAPYMNESGYLLAEGVAIDAIDQALVQFGFPVGPLTLLDEVGIDVGSKVGPILHQAFGERMKAAGVADRLLADGRYGRKSKKGFYRYEGVKKGEKPVDKTVYGVLGVSGAKAMDAQEIVERCVLLMLNEAARCWDEGVIRSARDGDIGAVFGIGFPPFLGGPFRYADSLGIAELLAKLEHYRQRLGERFAPAEILVRMARENRTFHTD